MFCQALKDHFKTTPFNPISGAKKSPTFVQLYNNQTEDD